MNDTVKKISLDEAAGFSYLTPQSVSFTENGDFPCAVFHEGGEEKRCERVRLHRVFPHDTEDEFISVQDLDGEELGMIRRLSDFDPAQQKILNAELERRYFVPKLKEISSLRERHGFSYWKITTDIGKLEITVQDTFKSILRIGGDKAIVVDITGNRYEIESLSALDKKSRKRLELYL